MTDFIDDVMGFNPTDLTVFNAPETQEFNNNIYKTNPKDSKAEDGHYRSKIRIIYNPLDIKQSIVKQATYAMNDHDGFFMVKSALANGDRNCPIFKSWKKLWFSGSEEKKEFAKKMYDKSESQWCLVQILEDDNRPELVGQIKAMKLPKAIFVKLEALMNPAPETKKTPVPVMDYIFGRALEMDVTPGPDDPMHPERKQREIKYDLCTFENDPTPVIKIDGTSTKYCNPPIPALLIIPKSTTTKHKTIPKIDAKSKTNTFFFFYFRQMDTLHPTFYIILLKKNIIVYFIFYKKALETR